MSVLAKDTLDGGRAGCPDQIWFMYMLVGLSFRMNFTWLMDISGRPSFGTSQIKV